MTADSKDPDRGPLRLVILHREEGFYPLQLPETDDLNAHAEANPGTLFIEDVQGHILWRPQ